MAVFATIDPTCRGADKPPTDASKAVVTTDAGVGKATTDPCSAAALGLANAAQLALWTPPAGCSARDAGPDNDLVRTAEALQQRLQCPAGAAPAVDFTKQALLKVSYTLSPAGAGVAAFDDGKVITIATRQRSPCPDAPMPMPMPANAWFMLAAGGERTFAATTCTLDSNCK